MGDTPLPTLLLPCDAANAFLNNTLLYLRRRLSVNLPNWVAPYRFPLPRLSRPTCGIIECVLNRFKTGGKRCAGISYC